MKTLLGIADDHCSRRRFIQSTATAGVALSTVCFTAAYAAGTDDFLKKSATEIAKLLKDKSITSVELVKQCYARIDAVNPKINATSGHDARCW